MATDNREREYIMRFIQDMLSWETRQGIVRYQEDFRRGLRDFLKHIEKGNADWDLEGRLVLGGIENIEGLEQKRIREAWDEVRRWIRKLHTSYGTAKLTRMIRGP
jgi:hypothetical protein